MKEIIIGRAGDQAFAIPENYNRVSKAHAKITIDDHGEWWITDLQSTNGTYVQGEDGEYFRVSNKRINEFTRIALGGTQVGCLIFFAHHVLEPSPTLADPERYSEEFDHVLKVYEQLRAEHAELKKRVDKRSTIEAVVPSVITIILGGALFLPELLTGQKINVGGPMSILRLLIMASGSLITMAIRKMSKDRQKMEKLQVKIKNLCTCPCCNLPLGEADFNRQSCPKCRAHV